MSVIKILAGISLASFVLSGPVSGQIVQQQFSKPQLLAELDLHEDDLIADYSKFEPRQPIKRTRLDYSLWDQALNNVVLDFGPSERKRALKPAAQVGSRFIKGHTSPYRLEGSRVTFAYIDDEYRDGLSAYRRELETVAGQVNLPYLSKQEQLAFWLNLHNVALIEQIALAYPIDQPARIKIKLGGQKVGLDEAKFLTVMGQKLSLKDIREEIVYRYWDDPRVIYGFFRGNIGSPRLPRAAYSASNLDYFLNSNAEEFVNSLRGFHESFDARKISGIYEEAARFYFPDFDADLTSHLRKFAVRDTIKEVDSNKPFKVDRYENVIADLSAGRGLNSSGTPIAGGRLMSVETQRLLAEVEEKYRRLRVDGILGNKQGYVIIEDLVPKEDSHTGSKKGDQD